MNFLKFIFLNKYISWIREQVLLAILSNIYLFSSYINSSYIYILYANAVMFFHRNDYTSFFVIKFIAQPDAVGNYT